MGEELHLYCSPTNGKSQNIQTLNDTDEHFLKLVRRKTMAVCTLIRGFNLAHARYLLTHPLRVSPSAKQGQQVHSSILSTVATHTFVSKKERAAHF